MLIEPSMSDIPGGELFMGVPHAPDEFGLCHRWHSQRLQVDSFRIACTAVTNMEYRCYIADTGVEPPDWMERPGFDTDQKPVVGTSWFDAQAYCDWLCDQTKKPYRLPTDAEWEYAARSGDRENVFPWGNDLSEAKACYGGQQNPRPVASFSSNEFGLYDMLGNVWEWCHERFEQVSGGLSAINKIEDADSTVDNRVLRGGSFMTTNSHCLWIAYRHEDPPNLRHESIGFRLAMSTA